MEIKKPILGLKATNFSDEESDVFFDSDDDSDRAPLQIAPSVPPPQRGGGGLTLLPPPPPPAPEKPEDRIKSFDDASPRITAILASLEDYDFKKASIPFSGDIYFIPEHIVSDEKSAEFNTYAHSSDTKAHFFAPSDAHEIVYAQIELVYYYKKKPYDFKQFKLKNLDSRISALIYYLLSKTDDHQVSLYYCFMSLTEFLKSPTVAPVASLFPDFDLKLIVYTLCANLVHLFPHHPLLPSVIHKFNNINPDVLSLLNQVDSEDSDTDFSDSFFDSITNVQQSRPPIIVLQGQFSDPLTNVLENCQTSPNDMISITVNEPPTTLTFHLPDGLTQFTPNFFVDWILSLYPKKDDFLIRPTEVLDSDDDSFDTPSSFNTTGVIDTKMKAQKKKRKKSSFSSKKVPLQTESSEKSNSDENSSTKSILESDDLIQLLKCDPVKAQKEMPNLESREDLFHIQFPLLQNILFNNFTSVNSINTILKKCPFPEILEMENRTNSLFVSENSQRESLPISSSSNFINDIYSKIYEIIPEKELLQYKTTSIQRLTKLRDMPEIEERECTSDDIKLLIYLSDIEFLLNGRSPLNLSRSGVQTSLSSNIRMSERASILYHFYSTKKYPPFITYRTAFALALNLYEYKSQYAADLLFEGIYALLNKIPMMAKLESVRSGMLFFAELLEKLDRYYYSCLLFDAFYLYSQNGSKLDLTSLTNIASLCQKNHDAARTAFYYSKSLERYVSNRQIEEALYITQMLANTYNDYGLLTCSLSVLCHILKDSYKLKVDVNSHTQVNKVARKSMRPIRKKIATPEFKPPPESINTLLTGISLCEVLLKLHYFTLSAGLLEEMKNSTDSQVFLRIIEYLQLRNLIKQNNFDSFMEGVSNIQIRLRMKRGISSSRLSLHNASNFDPSLATVKLIMCGCVSRNLFREAIFWSEIYIMAQTNQSLKDIGYGLLHRGIALKIASSQMRILNPPYSLHVDKMTGLMSSVGKYIKNRKYNSICEIISEAASSFKAAWICFNRVGGCSRLATKAILFYLDIVLHYFVDSLFEKAISRPDESKIGAAGSNMDDGIHIGKGDDDEDEDEGSNNSFQDEWLPGPEKLVIKEPQLEVQINDIQPNKLVSFQTTTLDISSVIDDSSQLFRQLDSNVNRDMNPVNIIYSQILKAKLNFLQHKESTAKTLFDYAYSNIDKYFVCAGDFISKRMKMKTLHLFQNILDNMVCFLFFFEPAFINDRLLVIDWRNDIQSIIQNRLRVVTEENRTPIESSIKISRKTLEEMSSVRFPNIEKTFELTDIKSSFTSNDINITPNFSEAPFNMPRTPPITLSDENNALKSIAHFNSASIIKHKTSSPLDDDTETTEQEISTIERYLAKISTNVRLFESQKVPESEMRSCNRKFCRLIEILADEYRRENEGKRPIDTSYSFVFKTRPNLHCAVFVEHIFESIYIYIPSKGLKRRVPLVPAKSTSSFTVSSNKGTFTYQSNSGLFNSKFFSIISIFLMCDKKQHHTEYNSSTASKIFMEAKEVLFGNICDTVLLDWKKEPDDHLFGESKLFGKGLKGALSSVITSTQPAIFFTCGDLRALPFEMMFPNVLILRSWSYCHAIIKPVELSSYPYPTVCRWKGTAEHLMQNAVKRSEEAIRTFLNGCGGWYQTTPYVKGNERNVCFPFPLFSSNKENNHYISKYHFCRFIDVEPNNYPKIEAALFIFTYSDMCEMPQMLKSLVTQFPFSFYMFIPAQFVREAFKLMISIFERHKRREEYFNKNLDNPEEMASKHSIILQVPYDFVTCLQDTLKEQLKCPISLIVPTH